MFWGQEMIFRFLGREKFMLFLDEGNIMMFLDQDYEVLRPTEEHRAPRYSLLLYRCSAGGLIVPRPL